jgi:hypothetical protein
MSSGAIAASDFTQLRGDCDVPRSARIVGYAVIGFALGAIATLLTYPDGASTESQRRVVGAYLIGGTLIGATWGLLKPCGRSRPAESTAGELPN